MTKKRMLALLMALGLTMTAITACGNSEGSNGGDNQNASDNGAESTSNVDADDDDADDEEAAEITVALMCFAPMDSSQTDAVEEAVNALTEKDINVHVDIEWYDATTYGTQIPMMIQANEKLDLLMFTPVPGASYTNYMSANQLMDISEILEEEGPTILATNGDLLKGTSKDGGIYGVTNYGAKAATQAMLMRKDVLDDLGLTEKAESAASWTDIEDILKEVVANTDLAGVVNSDGEGTVLYPRPYFNGGDSFTDSAFYDNLGDGYNLISIDSETDTVQCYYLTDNFKEMAERVDTWYQEGLIYKDAATAQDFGDTLLKNEVGFSKVVSTEIGSKESVEAATGMAFVSVPIADAQVSTGSCTKFGFAVPVTATEPEAAVKFLNYLYESKELANTLTWGVEGRDWTLNADGQATYPEGVTADTVLYHTGDFLYGNQFNVTPWEGSALDIREQQQAAMDATKVSKYMGFTVDSSKVDTQVTACYNVAQQYHPALDAGSTGNWESTVDEFQNKLIAAGIEDVVAEYQAQLDAWLAENAQ